MSDDSDDKPTPLRVVSDNPNARADREIARAKEQAQRALSEFAAALLRTMAGSASEANYLIRRLSPFIQAEEKLIALSGSGLTIGELREALRLPDSDLDVSRDDYAYKRWLREHGMETIVQGALRLAAHKILGERPHFGGKYSKGVIEDGISLLEESRRPRPKPEPQTKKRGSAGRWDDIDLGPPNPKPPGRRKPWSSRDSRSYRDLKSDDD